MGSRAIPAATAPPSPPELGSPCLRVPALTDDHLHMLQVTSGQRLGVHAHTMRLLTDRRARAARARGAALVIATELAVQRETAGEAVGGAGRTARARLRRAHGAALRAPGAPGALAALRAAVGASTGHRRHLVAVSSARGAGGNDLAGWVGQLALFAKSETSRANHSCT